MGAEPRCHRTWLGGGRGEESKRSAQWREMERQVEMEIGAGGGQNHPIMAEENKDKKEDAKLTEDTMTCHAT